MGQPLTAQVVAVVPDLRPVADDGHPWLRLDSDGGMHLLGRRSDGPGLEVVHLDPRGNPAGRTLLPAQFDPATWTAPIDLACDPAGACLLLATDPDRGLLASHLLDPTGSMIWTRAAPFAAAEHLLYRGGPIGYVTDGQGRVGEIDVTTGDLRQIIAWRDGAGRVFVGGDLLFFVHFDVRNERWCASAVGALGEPGWTVQGRADLEPWLRHSIGADAEGQLHLLHDGAIATLSADGVPDIVGPVPTVADLPSETAYPPHLQWQVDADGSIVFVAMTGGLPAVVRIS